MPGAESQYYRNFTATTCGNCRLNAKCALGLGCTNRNSEETAAGFRSSPNCHEP